jgi:hypothetical protein
MCLTTKTDLASRFLMALAVNEAVTGCTAKIARRRNFADPGRRPRLILGGLKSLAFSRRQPS